MILKLGDRIGEPCDEGVRVPVALTRQDLADLSGTTLETAIRVMSALSKEEVVLTERRSFLIRDRVRLERAASGD